MIKDARILKIDLTNESYKVETLPAEIYRKYPGGSALGMYLMMKEMDPHVDPLSPENMLIFSVFCSTKSFIFLTIISFDMNS